MLDIGDGRICIHEEDMERTELGKKVLRSPDARWKWGAVSGITTSEIPVRIITEGPGRGKVELKLGSRGTICVDKEDMERTRLGRALLASLPQPQPQPQRKAWVYSLACLNPWIVLGSPDLGVGRDDDSA